VDPENSTLAYGRISHEYRKNAVNGASPLQLVIMLYDGALRFMEAGKHAIAHGDLFKQNDQLQRAQKVIMELMSCLDMEKGGEVAKNLLSLYTYVLGELVKANCNDDALAIGRCIRVLSDLRESWVTLHGLETPVAA
jgi:flagellar protein FliS